MNHLYVPAEAPPKPSVLATALQCHYNVPSPVPLQLPCPFQNQRWLARRCRKFPPQPFHFFHHQKHSKKAVALLHHWIDKACIAPECCVPRSRCVPPRVP